MSATNGAAHTRWLVELFDADRTKIVIASVVDVVGVGSLAWERARIAFAAHEDIEPFDPRLRATLVPPEKRKQ